CQCRYRAFVWNGAELDTSRLRKKLRGHSDGCTRVTIGVFAWIGLGVLDEVGNALKLDRGADIQNVVDLGDTAYRLKILLDVVADGFFRQRVDGGDRISREKYDFLVGVC